MFDLDITKSVPRFILEDKNGYAVAKAIEKGLQMMNDVIKAGTGCVTDPDEMPEWRLDEMAWETNCLYDYKADVEVKRAWIKNALPLYKMFGTTAAINEVIKAMIGSGEVVEWFEENGEPYTFRVQTDGQTDESTLEKIFQMVEQSKNVRSTLAGINFAIKCDFDVREIYIIREIKKYFAATGHEEDYDVYVLTDETGAYLMDETGALLTG